MYNSNRFFSFTIENPQCYIKLQKYWFERIPENVKYVFATIVVITIGIFPSQQYMNAMKLVIPFHLLYWSIHTKDESKRGTAFAFIFGVNWLWRCGVTASFGVFFHEIKCNGMTSFMEFMSKISYVLWLEELLSSRCIVKIDFENLHFSHYVMYTCIDCWYFIIELLKL